MTEKEKANEYKLVEVATQTGLAIQTPEGNNISEIQLLVQIANDIKEIRKGL